VLNPEEIKKIETKIAAVESMTSTEFKIIICSHAWMGLKRKAHKLFIKHGLDKTKERNAVLILWVEKDREFLIYGDEGIHSKVGENFWLEVRDQMLVSIKESGIPAGLSMGLHLLADILAEHFPSTEEVDELSNKIIFEN
jgi:uncharacterized membrane protein